MKKGRVQVSLSEKSVGKVVVSLWKIRLEAKFHFIIFKRLVDFSQLQQDVAQIEMRASKLRVQFQSRAQIGERFVQVTRAPERRSQDTMSVGALRLGGYCQTRLHDRIVNPAFIQVSVSEMFTNCFIIRCDSQRTCPERFAVAPKGGLQPSAPSQRRQDRDRWNAQKELAVAPRRGKIDSRPDEDQAQPDLRKIHVTISVRLDPNLNNADDRDQHSHEPKPAGKEVRRFFSEQECRAAD